MLATAVVDGLFIHVTVGSLNRMLLLAYVTARAARKATNLLNILRYQTVILKNLLCLIHNRKGICKRKQCYLFIVVAR